MKKLTIALAALGAALMATAASAEPTQYTEKYFLIGVNDEAVSFLADAVETNADKKDVWVVMFNKTPEVIEGKTVQGAWGLTELDCTKSTMQLVRIEAMTDTGNIRISTTDEPSSIKPNTPGEAAFNLVCKNDASGVVLLTKSEAAAAVGKFRAQ